jgi:hypothetical protein
MQISLRPSLLDGTYPHLRPEPEFAEGRFRYVADVLLHEMVHHYHMEITENTEASFHGHGPAFRDECNRIGAVLRLPPVRSHKKRGPDKDLPSCAYWPHIVRPLDYYLGAVVEETPAPPVPPIPPKVCETCQAVSPLIDQALNLLASMGRGYGHVMTTLETYDCLKRTLTAMREMVPIVGDNAISEDDEED